MHEQERMRLNPRHDLTKWAVTATPGLVNTAMAHTAAEDKVVLNGGVAGFVVYAIPLADVFGCAVDVTSGPLVVGFVLELVTDGPFDDSTDIAAGIADSATLAAGVWEELGIYYDGVSGDVGGYSGDEGGPTRRAAASDGVKVVGQLGTLSADGEQGRRQCEVLNSSNVTVTSGGETFNGPLVATHMFFRIVRDGTAGTATVGVKLGMRVIPQEGFDVVG